MVSRWQIPQFGIEHLKWVGFEPPVPEEGEVVIEVRAASLNFRDLLVVRGLYNPKLPLPAVPLSDAAGVVLETGRNVTRVKAGDEVVTQFVTGWIDGRYRSDMARTTLGTPGPGVAAEWAVLPESALLPKPAGWSFAETATLPIAALTAWTALVTEGGLDPDGDNSARSVLALGTGGVSVFAMQFAKALGAKAVITSRSEAKLARMRRLGVDATIDISTTPDWAAAAKAATGSGADVVIETAGATLAQSIEAAGGGATIATIGNVAGNTAEVDVRRILMRGLRIVGYVTGSRSGMEQMLAFINRHPDLRPVIDRSWPMSQLPEAMQYMADQQHVGKVVVEARTEGA